MLKLSAPDLTQHPPRSPRVKLGGYAHLPRLLDKARASIAGKNGEFHYNCPLDRHFFDFTGIDHEALLAELKNGRSDSEMLAWVRAHTKRLPSEIAAWSAWLATWTPGAVQGHEWFGQVIKADSAERDDIFGFMELLDLDDYVSYGGKG
jgi:Domain of unknown function (DUF5069)